MISSTLASDTNPLRPKRSYVGSKSGLTRVVKLAISQLVDEIAPSIVGVPADRIDPETFQYYPKFGQAIQNHLHFLLDSEGQLKNYLGCDDASIKELAKKIANKDMDKESKVIEVETLLGRSIPGDTLESRYLRTCDPRYLRKALAAAIRRNREHAFLRMKLIGARRERYVSDHAVDARLSQLKRQTVWMQSSYVLPQVSAAGLLDHLKRKAPLSLAEISKGPAQLFSKLYTFVKAIESLGDEANLRSAMLTLTLEPEWHPNPSSGKETWNGSSPKIANNELCRRWAKIQRDLSRLSIYPTGLRVCEPHKDGCPHSHIWLLYRPENEKAILQAFMKYFPLKLKVKTPCQRGQNTKSQDVIYDTAFDLQAGNSRPVQWAKEGAQVDFARIDPTISRGASYVMKYLLKSHGPNLNDTLPVAGENLDAPLTQQQKAQKETALRVEAFCSAWQIKRSQLFGIARCLGTWDELRRLNTAPKHSVLHKLWALARGGVTEGRIEAGQSQAGNAVGFLKLLGGLDAARNTSKSSKRLVLARLTEAGVNQYGDAIRRIKGIRLVEKERIKIKMVRGLTKFGRQSNISVWRTNAVDLCTLKTRLTEWIVCTKAEANDKKWAAIDFLIREYRQKSTSSCMQT